MADPCEHMITQGREGETGTWCTACGVKVIEVHDRPCGECRHFRLDPGANVMGICRAKLMAVTSTMLVIYYLDPIPWSRAGLCFEPIDAKEALRA